jgi:hypothetical protein
VSENQKLIKIDKIYKIIHKYQLFYTNFSCFIKCISMKWNNFFIKKNFFFLTLKEDMYSWTKKLNKLQVTLKSVEKDLVAPRKNSRMQLKLIGNSMGENCVLQYSYQNIFLYICYILNWYFDLQSVHGVSKG